MLPDAAEDRPSARFREGEYSVVMLGNVEYERERAGLCADCKHVRLIRSDRGATFYFCERSASDKSFPKYPRLPVIQCRGYESKEPER
jgi:hypothetical protein